MAVVLTTTAEMDCWGRQSIRVETQMTIPVLTVLLSLMSTQPTEVSPKPDASQYKEVEIMPGVFMTDFRREDSSKQPKPDILSLLNLTEEQFEELKRMQEDKQQKLDEEVDPFAMTPQLIELDIKEIENNIYHLKRSNTELAEFFLEDPDPEYKTSIEDNEVVITKLEKRLYQLKEMLKLHFGGHSKEEVEYVDI